MNLAGFERLIEKRRIKFLEWVRDALRPRYFLYAGSGFDRLPKTVLGEDVVLHLSYEETDSEGNHRPYECGYLHILGSGKKIGANFLHIPLKDESVDIVYIHDAPVQVTSQALCEFYRVVKDDGFMILDNGGWHDREVEYFMRSVLKLFVRIEMLSAFCDPEDTWRQIVDERYGNSPGCGEIIGHARTTAEMRLLLKKIPVRNRSITTQTFAVFKKKVCL